MPLTRKQRTVAKTVLWIAALTPALWLLWDFRQGNLSVNPIEDITHRTGWWALTLLTTTLAITPIRRVTGWHDLIRFRRLVGLFAFFYATLHLLVYVVLDRFFAFGTVLEDIAERPFITVGFAAWLILLALASTSTRGWIRRLGRKWQRLHRLVYLAGVLGAIHFYWKVKADTREPWIFIAILVVLLGSRLPPVRRFVDAVRRRRSSADPAPAGPRPEALGS